MPPGFVFHRNESDGRSCHHQYFKKTLVSGEKMAITSHHMKTIQTTSICMKAWKELSVRLKSGKTIDKLEMALLKEVELMTRFDPIMKDHLNCVKRGTASHNSYLGHHVQNKLIDLLSSKIKSAIVDDIKQAKFFSNSGLNPRYKPHRTVISGH